MAARFAAGGRLLVFGSGGGATDAEHIAVEFVHPVIVGKRALPALSLASDSATLSGAAAEQRSAEMFTRQLMTVGRPSDIAMGIVGVAEDRAVNHALDAARSAGMLTVALSGGGPGGVDADHTFNVASSDVLVVKEAHVTTYHLLWELVHVFFDTPGGEASEPGGVESLYPFLYGGSHDAADVLASAAASTVAKVDEITRLRSETAHQLAEPLARCATELGPLFAGGATLWSFGNGGSSTDAQDVAHTFLDPPAGRPLAASCLTSDVAVVTALSNDIGFEAVFARQLGAFSRRGDVAIGLSTSGGSTNVLNALTEATRLGLTTIGIAGYGGGPMADLAVIDHLFAVSSSSVHRVQEVQTTIYHVLWELVQTALGT
jgi:D-sedoheptulose 7-phosphate isomerase